MSTAHGSVALVGSELRYACISPSLEHKGFRKSICLVGLSPLVGLRPRGLRALMFFLCWLRTQISCTGTDATANARKCRSSSVNPLHKCRRSKIICLRATHPLQSDGGRRADARNTGTLIGTIILAKGVIHRSGRPLKHNSPLSCISK